MHFSRGAVFYYVLLLFNDVSVAVAKAVLCLQRARQSAEELAQKEAVRQHEQKVLEMGRQRDRERQMQVCHRRPLYMEYTVAYRNVNLYYVLELFPFFYSVGNLHMMVQ